MNADLHQALRRFFGIAAAVLLSVPSAVFADILDNDEPIEEPGECDARTSTSCDCDKTEDGVENGCILMTLGLGSTTPWTGSDPVRLRIYTGQANPSISTPAQLKLVLGYTFKNLGADRTSTGAPATVDFVQSKGLVLRFRFVEGSSVGVPLVTLRADDDVRLQMVDVEGWATLSNPAYYDLHPGDGSVWRFVADPSLGQLGDLVRTIDSRGVVRTPEDMGVTVHRDAAGFLRQVCTPTRLADVRILDDRHYTVTVYPLVAEPETDSETGLFVPPANRPTRILDVRRGENDRELIVGFQKGTGDMRTFRYVAQNGDWTLVRPSGLRDAKELYYNDDEGGARRLHLVKAEDGTLLRRTEQNYMDCPWGWAITNKVEGLEGELRNVTTWSYYLDGLNKGKVSEKVEPNGNRIVYEYDALNRLIRRSMPLVEEETLYSYAPVDPSDPVLLRDTRPRCVVRKMQGVEIQRTYYVYGTNGVDVVERVGEQGAAYGGTNVLRTVTTYYPATGAVTDGLVQSVRHEDSTIDNYTYDLTDGVWTEFVTHVHEQAPDIVPMRTTRSVRVYDTLGQLIDSRTDLCTIGVEDLVPQADWTPIARLQYAYDIDGNEIRREDLAGRLWTAEWAGNCCGKISETDWQGITTTYAYDAEGRVIANQTGSVLTETAYDALGRATNVARRGIATADRPAATVHPSSFAYDSLGRETMSEGEDGIRRLFSYSYRPEGGEVRTVTEAPGTDCERVTTIVSDAAGRTIGELRNGILRRSIVYAPLLETIYDGSKGPNSPVWRETNHDLFGRLAETRKPGFGGAVLYSRNAFDAFGNTVEIEDGYTSAAPGFVPVVTSRRLSTFDEFGGLALSAEDVNRNGRIDLAGPDVAISNVVGHTVANGSLWSTSEAFVFPDEGSDCSVSTGRSQIRLTGLGGIEETQAIGNAILTSEAIALDVLGNATKELQFVNRGLRKVLNTRQLPTSNVSQETVTESGAIVLSRSPENVTTTNRCDALLRHVATVDLFGNSTLTEYDEFGRLAWREDPSGARTTYDYDALGRQVSVTDALGNEKTTVFDVDDNAVSLRGAQYPVDYSYDEYGRMRAMTTYRTENLAHGDVTTWLRDKATGLVTNKVYADGKGPMYAYAPDGKLTRTTWARGAWFENVYDGQGRVVQVLHDDATLNAVMAYDRLGRLVSSSVPAASYRYTLDLLGHATNEIAIITGVTNTIIRDYDAFGRQSRLRIADSDYDESFSYDDLGRLSVIGIPDSTITYAYTPDSLDAGYSVLTPSNAVLTRALTRDPLRRGLIASVSNRVNGVDSGSSFDYTYDALKRPVARNLDAFGYNARSEVSWARYGTNTLTDIYDYDLIGNFTSNRLGGAWTQFAANELNEYATITDTVTRTLAYDFDGNLITNGGWSYGYDSENRLETVSLEGVTVLKNFYDPMSRRIGSFSGETLVLLNYDEWNVLQQDRLSTTSNQRIPFYWGKETSGRLHDSGGVGGLLCSFENGGPHYAVYDNNGNITGYQDASGQLVAQYYYDAFGSDIKQTVHTTSDFVYGFSTKSRHNVSKLYYFGFRFYDPSLSRWLNRDPICEKGGSQNIFLFCENNAVNTYDILGLSSRRCKSSYDFVDHGWDYTKSITGPYSITKTVGTFSQSTTVSNSYYPRHWTYGVTLSWISNFRVDCCCRNEKYYPAFQLKIESKSWILDSEDPAWQVDHVRNVSDPKVRQYWYHSWEWQRRWRVRDHEQAHRTHAKKNFKLMSEALKAHESDSFDAYDECLNAAAIYAIVEYQAFNANEATDAAAVERGEY